MDKPEDAKGPSADKAAAAGPTDATPAAQAGQGAEPKPEIAHIEAPSIVPAAEPANAPVGEGGKRAVKPDEAARALTIVAAMQGGAKPAASAPSPKRASAWRGRIVPLAAAAVVGLVVGALGATALPQIDPVLFGAAPLPAEAPSVTAAITQMRADLAALKTSSETTSRSTNAQLAKLSERFDRFERAQAAGSKSDMAVAKETTGSIAASPPPAPPLSAAPSAAAVPLPPAPVPGIVSGWVVRDVYHGAALLQGRLGGMIEVGPGDILPGVGRIEAIRREGGRWVVITPKGMIVSTR
jgi:hypothetical protein